MLVYGDAKRLERADMLCAEIASRLQAAQHLPAGIERHTELVAILLRAGELVQGLADLELAQMGADEISASRQTGECLLLDLAGLVARSWRQGFAGPVVVPARVARSLANSQAPLSLSIREPEGYAFYALYPESYLEAAAGSGLPADTVVIGLRSIGTTLSAIVAASIGARLRSHCGRSAIRSNGGLQSRRNLRNGCCATGRRISRSWTKDPAFPAARSDASRIGWRITASAAGAFTSSPATRAGLDRNPAAVIASAGRRGRAMSSTSTIS